jgi:hypothetical protein
MCKGIILYEFVLPEQSNFLYQNFGTLTEHDLRES